MKFLPLELPSRCYNTRRVNVSAIALATALALGGCSDVAPLQPVSRLSLSEGRVFDANVNTAINIQDEKGTVLKTLHQTKRVRVQLRAGHGSEISHRAIVQVPGAGRQNLLEDPAVVPDSISLVPFYALESGEMSSDFDESGLDSAGHPIRVIGFAPGDGSPVTELYTYVNGSLAQSVFWTWSYVDGGYVLATQTAIAYAGSTGSSVHINSTVSGSVMIASNGNVFRRAFASVGSGINALACYLGPQTAYAWPRCTGDALVFAFNTFVLGDLTITLFVPPLSWVAVGVYFGTWGGWTHSLASFLTCLGRQTR